MLECRLINLGKCRNYQVEIGMLANAKASPSLSLSLSPVNWWLRSANELLIYSLQL